MTLLASRLEEDVLSAGPSTPWRKEPLPSCPDRVPMANSAHVTYLEDGLFGGRGVVEKWRRLLKSSSETLKPVRCGGKSHRTYEFKFLLGQMLNASEMG